MPIHLETLTDLAKLIAVLDLQKLAAMTSVPLHLMPTDNLGRDDSLTSALDSARRQHRHVDQLGAHVTYGPSDPKLDGVQVTSTADLDAPADGAVATSSPHDSAGLPHDGRIHSEPPKFNKDGTWRARRGVSEETVAEVTAQLRGAQASAQAPHGESAASEPVATETHALPTEAANDSDDSSAASGALDVEAADRLDLSALIEAATAGAGDASDSLQELLGVARDFIGGCGTVAFNDLKAAVAPDGVGGGKALPQLTPAERRTLRYCLDNYALYV